MLTVQLGLEVRKVRGFCVGEISFEVEAGFFGSGRLARHDRSDLFVVVWAKFHADASQADAEDCLVGWARGGVLECGHGDGLEYDLDLVCIGSGQFRSR